VELLFGVIASAGVENSAIQLGLLVLMAHPNPIVSAITFASESLQ
jgi:hypothetical protein